MIRAGVIGATGYAGAELVRILSGHPDVTLSLLTSRQYAGDRFDRIYPAMAGHIPHVLETFSVERACDAADILFISLPHKLPMEIVPQLVAAGKRVVDLSADFRFKDVAAYEAHYQPHTAPHLLPKAVYGLSEIYTDDIRNADLIGNPGCYPTSVLLPVIPLLKAGLIDPDTLIADAKSGVSGAGRSASVTSLYCEVAESFKAYKVMAHRHNPEMNEILSRQADRPVRITFVPHLIPMSRGMETTIYATLARKAGWDEILACLETFYRGRSFIRICPKGRVPNTLHVRGTNYCDIGVAVDEPSRRVILMSVIDNLVKGAAGQAVQNMNLMLGIAETRGLSGIPYPV